jgi:hypothetical protein
MIASLMRGLLVILVAATLLAHARLIANLNYDGENSLTEGETLFALVSVQQRQTLYHDFRHPPHVLTQYTPLFYYIPGLVARGLETGTLAAFLVGRCYAYGCWLGVAALIFFLARQYGCGWRPALLGTLIFLSAPLTTGWANSYRPDSAAVFFSLAAVMVYAGGKRMWGVILLLVAAFFHKQSAVVALLVIGWEELRARRWQRVAVLAVGWTASVVGGMWWLQVWSGGAFRLNCFSSLGQMHDWRWPGYLFGGAVLLGAAGFAGGILGWGARSRGLLHRYFVFSLGFAFLSSVKFGSWTNYYIEPFAVACILTAIGLADEAQPRMRQAAWMVVAFGVTFDVLLTATRPSQLSPPRDWKALRELGQPVLIEDCYAAARLGGKPYMLNPGIFARLERAGRFDSTGLRRAIERGELAAIVCRQPLEKAGNSRPFPPEWVELMSQHYSLAGHTESNTTRETFWVYRP